MAEIRDYEDIGHGMASFDAALWLFRAGKIETHSAAAGTHNSIWGQAAMHYWRGRYEKPTGRLSVASPALQSPDMPPAEVLQALQATFPNFKGFYFGRKTSRQDSARRWGSRGLPSKSPGIAGPEAR
jgi:hypothetical protein